MRANLDTTFSALSDSTRREILKLLLARDLTVTEIAKKFTMTLAGISKHLQILSRAGLISRQRDGRNHRCRIEIDGLRDAFAWMQEFGFVDGQILDALEYMLAQNSVQQSTDNYDS